MALNSWRWLALAIIGFAVVAAIFLRDVAEGERNVNRSTTDLRAQRAATHLTIAAERLRILQVIDSVRAALGPSAAKQSRTAIGKEVQPRLRLAISALLERTAADRPASPVAPVDIAFVIDTLKRVRGHERLEGSGFLIADYVVPRAGSNDRCLVLVRMRPGSQGVNPRVYSRLMNDFTRHRLLGPCAYYERFGHPGPQIDRWLRNQGWAFGLVSMWSTPPRRWGSVVDEFGGIGDRVFEGWRTRSGLSMQGFRCITGDLNLCEDAILNRPVLRYGVARKSRVWSDGIVSTGESFDWDRDERWWITPRQLGPRDMTILSEMVRTMGPDTFQRFWRSTDAPRQAFEAASNMDLAGWTHDWAERMYGKFGRGPGLPARNALVSALFALVALGVAVFAASRRRVA